MKDLLHTSSTSARRSHRIEERTRAMMDLEDEGYEIIHKGEHSYLINSYLFVDLLHNSFRNEKNNERGSYKSLKKFVRNYVTYWDMKMYEKGFVLQFVYPPEAPRHWLTRFIPGYAKFLKAYDEFKENCPVKEIDDYEGDVVPGRGR